MILFHAARGGVTAITLADYLRLRLWREGVIRWSLASAFEAAKEQVRRG